jgi:hypothetical protein
MANKGTRRISSRFDNIDMGTLYDFQIIVFAKPLPTWA